MEFLVGQLVAPGLVVCPTSIVDENDKLRAEVEALKADRAKIAVEALSTEGELDAASGSLYNRTRELMEAKARIKEAGLQVRDLIALLRRAEDALGPDRTESDRRDTLMALGKALAEKRFDVCPGCDGTVHPGDCETR